MSEEEDKPNRQLGGSARLEIGTEVHDTDEKEKWVALREIGKGAFGTVYHVVNKTTKQEAALKIEKITDGDNLLKIEREIMNAMKNEPTAIHIFDDGIFGDYRFIVMTLCGLDLDKIAILMNNKFQQETILRLCIRTLLAIKTLHEYYYIHRDLKPCNFAVDFNVHSLHVYIFDYGMARKYVRNENGRYYLRRGREQVQFRGSVRYCSLNMHKRRELGRVDDVWSWFFMMMEMHSQLPWSSCNNPDRVEAFKEEHLIPYLEKDPFYRSLIPIVQILSSTGYFDRPDYLKIYDFLYKKLKEINGKLSGPMEYDEARIGVRVAELGEIARPKIHSRMDDEITITNYLITSFNKFVIPGGEEYKVPNDKDFFKPWTDKKPTEEKTDEHNKRRSVILPKHKRQSSVTKNKMLGGKAKQPSSSGLKIEPSASKMSGQQKVMKHHHKH